MNKQTPSQDRYPSAQERERIIQRREKLMQEIVRAMVMNPNDIYKVGRLALKYPPEDLEAITWAMEKGGEAQMIGDKATSYRK